MGIKIFTLMPLLEKVFSICQGCAVQPKDFSFCFEIFRFKNSLSYTAGGILMRKNSIGSGLHLLLLLSALWDHLTPLLLTVKFSVL